MIPCSICGKDSGWKKEVFESDIIGADPSIPKCDPCYEKAYAEYKLEQQSERLNKRFESLLPIEELIPANYLETEEHKLPKPAREQLAKVMAWTPESGQGLYLLGHPRQGKTRTLSLLLKKLYNEGKEFKVFWAGQFARELAYKKALQTREYQTWWAEVTNVPILAIDDLYAEKLTPTIQSGLFEVIEARMGKKLPTLVTTQVKTDDAVKLFEDERRGLALARRLKETSIGILFNQDINQSLLVA